METDAPKEVKEQVSQGCLTNMASCCCLALNSCLVEHTLIHCWTEHWLSRTSNPLRYVFFNISLPFPFQNKENWKCLLASTNVSALCLNFDEVSTILQAQHIRALLSRSSGEMKFDSSSCMLKPVYFAFVKTMLEFFLQTSSFFLNHEHIRQDQRAK